MCHMRSTPSSRPWLQPDRIQGLVFDGAMFLANFYLLGTLLATPIDEIGNQRAGILLGLGVLAHLLGALLKKKPLRARIEALEEERSGRRENLLGCFSFLHFLFFLVAVAMSLALLGFVDLNENGGVKEAVWFLCSVGVAAFISGTVWQSIRYPEGEADQDIGWRYQEAVANLLLWISATILTRVFWTGILLESEPPSYMGFSPWAFVLIAAVSALFMVFYVPPRLLFLAEDYKYPVTWIRLWLVAMLPLISIIFISSGTFG
jgi:hypothetical protein